MSLIANWRWVLRRAHSVKFLALASVFSGLEAALPYLDGWLPFSRGTFAALAFACTAGAFITRFIAQR